MMASKAVRAFYYLIWICTREARHNHSLSKDLPQIGKEFGPEMQAFLTDIKGGETGISQKFLDNPPNDDDRQVLRRSPLDVLSLEMVERLRRQEVGRDQ